MAKDGIDNFFATTGAKAGISNNMTSIIITLFLKQIFKKEKKRKEEKGKEKKRKRKRKRKRKERF